MQGPPPPPPAVEYVITAYTSGYESTGKRPGHPLYGITSSGERVKAGVTAACPPEIPFGTVLAIEGVGERTCMDTGSAIHGRRIDLYVPTVKQALEFGKQTLNVRILNEKEAY